MTLQIADQAATLHLGPVNPALMPPFNVVTIQQCNGLTLSQFTCP